MNGRTTPLVRRAGEVVAQRAALGAVTDGQSRVIVLHGPARIDKSRLLELVRGRPPRAGIAVAADRAVELDWGTPGR
jgi:hypothetical protein